MASKQMLVAALAVPVLLPLRSAATEHVVGDENGWVLGFGNGAACAETKQFRIGDTLGAQRRQTEKILHNSAARSGM
ncbi:hypothetical protein ABZP36_020039 [Zizania latifolia]